MRMTVCGEALIDLFQSPNPDERLSSLGGSPLNTAVALGKVGESVSFLGRLGDDHYADELMTHLETNGVDTSLVVRVSEPTSIANVTQLPGGMNEYEFDFAGTANFGWRRADFPRSVGDWLHFGSLVYLVEPGASSFLRWVQKIDCQISVDLNIRPSVEPNRERYWGKVLQVLSFVGSKQGIVKLSLDDLAWLIPGSADDLGSAITVLRDWLTEYGLNLILLTLGDGGALAIQKIGKLTLVPGFQVEVVDTIGAGDTFMAGFLSIWLRGEQDLTLALRYGNAAAALSCGRVGANPPTSEEVEEFLIAQVAEGD